MSDPNAYPEFDEPCPRIEHDQRLVPHHPYAPPDPADFAAPDFSDPARFTWLMHPSGRKHPVNNNDGAVIRVLLGWGWTETVPLAQSKGGTR